VRENNQMDMSEQTVDVRLHSRLALVQPVEVHVLDHP
jgi:hypothetical protein